MAKAGPDARQLDERVEAHMAETDAGVRVELLPVDYRNITPVSPYSA